MPSRRRILGALTRTRLLEMARVFKLSGLTGKSKDEIVSKIARLRSIELPDLLRMLNRNELKAACRAGGRAAGVREAAVGGRRPQGVGHC